MSDVVHRGLAPFVARAMDGEHERYEALGRTERARTTESSGPEWGAARSAATRLD